MTVVELHLAKSQANNWTLASWSVMADIVQAAWAQLNQLEGAAQAQLILHAAFRNEPRICSSCRKKEPALGLDTAFKTCTACSETRKRARAFRRAALAGQEEARASSVAKRALKEQMSRDQQVAKALAELSHQEVQASQFPVV